jgi:rhodanese-related sulfurtransferase
LTTSLPTISTSELWERLREGGGLVLVDALPPMSFAASHLPGAISIPPGEVAAVAPQRIPDLDVPIVVYCAGPDCDSSVLVCERLVELGYRSVLHYRDGKRGWAGAGLPLEGGRVERERADPPSTVHPDP